MSLFKHSNAPVNVSMPDLDIQHCVVQHFDLIENIEYGLVDLTKLRRHGCFQSLLTFVQLPHALLQFTVARLQFALALLQLCNIGNNLLPDWPRVVQALFDFLLEALKP
ncbi:MAG TPA: hypothetical protein VL907_15725 [Pyrinomonadaceae bacterium]|nr:hypothetical protein [Pyrinomonadaceae bacterium]